MIDQCGGRGFSTLPLNDVVKLCRDCGTCFIALVWSPVVNQCVYKGFVCVTIADDRNYSTVCDLV